MSHVLAIDAGTGSVRAALFTVEGRFVAVASRPWEHDPEPGVPGSMGFATERNHALVLETVREVLATSGIGGSAVQAVSASAMREGLVVLDAAGRELWACANVDSRADVEVVDLQARTGLLEEVYRRSGQTFALAAQPRLLWLARHRPDLYERAARVVMLSEWVLHRLGAEPVMEPSNGSTSGMLALATRSADPELATLCGLRGDLVPDVVEPGTAVGKLSDSAAEATGLAAGIPLAVGGGDAQLAALGLGQTEPGQVLLTGGTFWQLNVNIGEPLTHPDLAVRVNGAAVPGLWQAEAIAFHPGTAVRWFRDTFAAPEVATAREGGRNPLDVLTEAAARVPVGADGVIPIFSDVMDYRHWRHAAPSFLNLSLDGGPRLRAAMFRSLLENAAVVSAANLDLVSSFAPVAPDAPVVFAGGAAASPVWSQIVADALGRSLRVPKVTEATAQGTAACAATAAGALGTPADAAAWVTWEREVTPDPERHERYREVRARWETAYTPQRELARRGVTTPMWHAPGS
ncbi:autoinducer-2 kinase [Actinotalea sp. JY-7885]|uniref:autoinducer-2 kinase n=1 Tax=Actinotalea sp. JY-7885 TaxID=2758576 RepID=UPI00165E1FEE|nr:autoinducer-2 kinase [Actinotalea sp. JY-7885]